MANPKTKRKVLERVTKKGELSHRAQELLAVKCVPEFLVVNAVSWKQATAKIRAGGGKKVRAA